MGRAPCCDKANVKKGPWSPEEDAKLKAYIEQHGTGGNWIALPHKIGLKRCGKSCRLRWLNYLRPNIKHGGFSEEEDKIICSLYVSIGSRWSIIAAQLPGRTDNDIKNYWNTRLKKKLLGKQRKEQQSRRGNSLKQEMKKRNGDCSIIPDHNNLSPYWPQLPPIPYSNQEHQIIDSQASMRRLLIKLGGKFSDEDHHHHHDVINDGSSTTTLHGQLPNASSSSQHRLYEQTIYFPSSSSSSSSSPMDALNNSIGADLFLNSQYSSIDGANLQILQGPNSTFPHELHEMVYSNSQRLDGMEFLYGEDMVSQRALNPCESIGWSGNTSNLVCPLVASEYEGLQQEMLQQYGFNKLRYPGAQ